MAIKSNGKRAYRHTRSGNQYCLTVILTTDKSDEEIEEDCSIQPKDFSDSDEYVEDEEIDLSGICRPCSAIIRDTT